MTSGWGRNHALHHNLVDNCLIVMKTANYWVTENIAVFILKFGKCSMKKHFCVSNLELVAHN